MIEPLVEFIANQPGLTARLLARHRPDRSGRCRQYHRTTPTHPCPLHLHARAAADQLPQW